MSTELTQSFIEMVKAYEAKPALEAEVSRLGEDNALCYQTIDLKNSIISGLNEDLAALRTELAEVKKREEDASFRNLELDEKLAGIEKLLGVAERLEQARRDEHKATVDAMTPKPELVDLSKAPIPNDPWYDPSKDFSGPIDPIVIEPQGQSDLNPTVSLSETATDTTTSKDGPETQTQSEPKINPYTGFPIHYPDGEYKGQPYYDKPSWVSWAAWVDAGGEAEPYMQQVTR